jgi:hypothetical protein
MCEICMPALSHPFADVEVEVEVEVEGEGNIDF